MITQSQDLELSSLACLIKDGSCYSRVEDVLSKKVYTNPIHQIIFSSIRDLYNSDILPDKVTVIVDLQKRGLLNNITLFSNGLVGKEAIEYLANLDVDTENIESYAFQLSEFRAIRESHEALTKALTYLEEGQKPDRVWGFVDLEGGKIVSYTGGQSKNIRTIKDVAQEAIRNLSDATENKHLYISTGLSAWDDVVNGLYPQRLYMVAARSGKGKSTVCINLAYRLSILANIKTTYFSLESKGTEIFNKMIQMETGIDGKKIDRGTLSEEEKIEYARAAKKIQNSENLIIDESTEILLPILRSKMRKAVENGTQVFIIDQLEQVLVGGGGDTVTQEHIRINYITYRIKGIARELNVPVILVHQLNRAGEQGQNRGKDTPPQLSDLAQAGEKAPDAVLMLAQLSTGTWFYWTKNRTYGDTRPRKVNFVKEKLWYEDIEGLSEFTKN